MNTKADLSPLTGQDKADIACAFQLAVADTIRIKCRRAFIETGLNQMVIAGGVSANLVMRSTLDELTNELGCRIYYPDLKFCTDNGAMIAYAGYERLKAGHTEDLPITVRPRWPMTELSRSSQISGISGKGTTHG